jgi:hypothetical protein
MLIAPLKFISGSCYTGLLVCGFIQCDVTIYLAAETEFSKYFTALSRVDDLADVLPHGLLAGMPGFGESNVCALTKQLTLVAAALEREPRDAFPSVVQVLRGTARVPVLFELGQTHIKITSVGEVCGLAYLY